MTKIHWSQRGLTQKKKKKESKVGFGRMSEILREGKEIVGKIEKTKGKNDEGLWPTGTLNPLTERFACLVRPLV